MLRRTVAETKPAKGEVYPLEAAVPVDLDPAPVPVQALALVQVPAVAPALHLHLAVQAVLAPLVVQAPVVLQCLLAQPDADMTTGGDPAPIGQSHQSEMKKKGRGGVQALNLQKCILAG